MCVMLSKTWRKDEVFAVNLKCLTELGSLVPPTSWNNHCEPLYGDPEGLVLLRMGTVISWLRFEVVNLSFVGRRK